MSYITPPTGGADVQDALIATQRHPDYLMGKKESRKLPESQADNISGYVAHNIGTNVQKRYGEHR
jgi:hypothetical protein